ncbi:MAG TPA: NUDIX domain-containing protein [Longilinea sp.]|nr:NUDIX domain-containing protein [Longilinea sp.]
MEEIPQLGEWPVRFCPYCGTATEVQFLYGADRAVCPACGWRHFNDPKVAAAVVVWVDGLVLLTRRVNEPHRGQWTLPAGFVDANEDPVSAAERECLEETGLQVRVTGLMDVLVGREHRHGADIFIVYTADVVGGTLHAGDDADDAGFFPLDRLPPLAFQTTQRILYLLR